MQTCTHSYSCVSSRRKTLYGICCNALMHDLPLTFLDCMRVCEQQETKARSRYEEDVYINNHTSVWGSFWKDGMWGYGCCHQFVKNSYCTGASLGIVMWRMARVLLLTCAGMLVYLQQCYIMNIVKNLYIPRTYQFTGYYVWVCCRQGR